MDRIGRPIFRGEALRRYIDRQEASMYPKLLARYKSIWLWSALAFLITAFILVISIRVPRQLSCVAVSTDPGRGEFMLLVKTDRSAFVSPGCEAVLELEAKGRVIKQVTLMEILPGEASDVLRRFGLDERVITKRHDKIVLALAKDSGEPDSAPAISRSEVYDARISVGYTKAISYLAAIAGAAQP